MLRLLRLRKSDEAIFILSVLYIVKALRPRVVFNPPIANSYTLCKENERGSFWLVVSEVGRLSSLILALRGSTMVSKRAFPNFTERVLSRNDSLLWLSGEERQLWLF
eukprot:Plantae.Rhodophyta-Rhodochaete_pulchella.ctg2333.p2 GENE.Plantae.Rhodophyta-Rhodochaete_pulchella.ctg2333~~Plantae.Rhodophyta-Rhodochaete_pulchella.ctg2333.p2  ORF type:complete len:107 (-),score=8.24 Plantae.Rhodophyta-Rhodochaete_pulchella.ctg2333:742-1062(-)